MSSLLYYIPKDQGLSVIHPNQGLEGTEEENSFIKNGLFAEQTQKINELLSESSHDSVTVKACKYAMESNFVSMKEAFSRSLKQLNMSELDVGMTRHMLLLALQKKKYFLQLVEMVVTSTDATTQSLLTNLVSSVHHQLSANEESVKNSKIGKMKKNSDAPTLTLSSWSCYSLVFDIAVANPVFYSYPNTQKTVPPKILSSLAAATNIPKGKIELPVSLEVRTISSIDTSKDNSESSSCTYKLRTFPHDKKLQTYSVKVLSCYHTAREEQHKSRVVGDVTVLVSLLRIGNKMTNIAPEVKVARAVQTNAYPSSINEILDIFSSTYDNELTMLVRFTTKSCCNNEDPKLVLELTV